MFDSLHCETQIQAKNQMDWLKFGSTIYGYAE